MAATREAIEKILQPYISAAESETPTGEALCAERIDENQRVSSRPNPAEGRPDSSLYKRPIPQRILNVNDESEDDGTKSNSEDLMDFSNSSQGPGSRRSVPSRHTVINDSEPNFSSLSDNKSGKFFEACNTKVDRGKSKKENGTHSAANSPAIGAVFEVQDPNPPRQLSSSLMEYNGDNNEAARASGNSSSCSNVIIDRQDANVVQGCESGGGLKTVVVKGEGSTSSRLPTEDNRESHKLLFTRSPTHLSSNTQASIPNKRKNRKMQANTHGHGRGGHRDPRTSDSTSNSFYQVLPESNRRTQGYQPPNTPTQSPGIKDSAQRQAKYTGRADEGDRNHGSSNKEGKDHTTLPSQDARNHQNQSGFQGHNRQKQPTGNKPEMLENTDPLRSILTEQNPAVVNPNPPTTSDSKHGVNAAQASKSRTTPTKNPSWPMGASKAAVISPSHYMRRPVPDRSSLLPPAGPNDIFPVGNWDSSDAWTNPGLFNRSTIYDDSRDDIDFTARPVNDVKIKVAYTAQDNSGKQVVQGPIDLANRAEYPTPATSRTKQPSPKGIGNGTLVVTDEERSPHLPPHQRMRVNVPSPVDSSTIKEQVKAERSEDKVKRSVEPSTPPHLRIPKPVQAGGLDKDTASQPSAVALPPHLRPPKKPQNDQLDKVKTSTEPLANDSRGVLPHTTTTAKDHSKIVNPHLVTEASFFLSQIGHPSEVIDTRAQPVEPASLATTAPTIDASPKVPNISSASLEHAEGKAMPSTTEPSSTQVRHDQESQVKERDARSGLPDEDFLSGRPDQRGPFEPSLSNLSMRGDEMERLSDLSGSLNFDDAFQASNPSDIYPKISDGGFNPYRKNEYDNSLRGWDGDWGPAPIEWDRRELYDYDTAKHKVFVQTFVINRIKAFKAGFCPAVAVDDEDFIQGRSLANGGLEFGKPIDESEHHHFRDNSPFTLHHLHNTAQIAIDNYIRGKRTLLDKEEAKEARKLAKAEKKMREQVSNENKEGGEARSISKVEKKARKQVASEKAGVEPPPNPYLPKANIYIRPARVKDLPQIRGLFNHYVEECAVTGERSKLSDRDWRDRFDLALTEKFPFIVAVGRHQFNKQYGGEKIVGFAYAEDYGGEQSMWRHTCELQFYVHHTCVKKGVGKNLVDCIMRGLNSLYRAKAAVDFPIDDPESARHDGGGERLLSHILIPYSYLSEQLEQTKWVGEWLTREFGFELQGTLKGIGRVGNPGKAVDIATYVLETGLM